MPHQHGTETNSTATNQRQTTQNRRQLGQEYIFPSLDKTEMQVLSYGLKHSVTPKRIPTETIVSIVEAVLSRQRDLSEPVKDNIRSRIASTSQSAT